MKGYQASEVLRVRREKRAAVAKMLREIRAEVPACEGRNRVLRHWRARGWAGCGTLGLRERVPGRCTVESLRREGRAALAFSREPVRPSYCGREDIECDRKADAGFYGTALIRAAALVKAGR